MMPKKYAKEKNSQIVRCVISHMINDRHDYEYDYAKFFYLSLVVFDEFHNSGSRSFHDCRVDKT